MTPCVCYTRVSSEEQVKVGYSIPFQRSKVEQYAREQNFEIVQSFEDVQTARFEGRQGFELMLKFLEEHPKVEHVLVHKFDRISRNYSDLGALLERIGAKIRSVTEPTTLDDAPMTVMQQGLSITLAKYYSANLSMEVRKGMQGRFEAGGCLSKAPVGYKNISRTKTERSKVIVDEKVAKYIEETYARYATGTVSTLTLGRFLYEQGVRSKGGYPLSDEAVRKILINPFYRGVVRYRNETRPGLHKAIVSDALWFKVQEVLKERARGSAEKGRQFFLLRGTLFCGKCHRFLTAENHPKGSYYLCMRDNFGERCGSPYSPVKVLDTMVEEILPRITMTEEGKTKVLAELTSIESGHENKRAKELAPLQHRIGILMEQRLRLTTGYTTGAVPSEDYLILKSGIEAEIASLHERERLLDGDISKEVQLVRKALDVAHSIDLFYRLATTKEAKKKLLQHIFQRIEVIGRKITKIEYKPPFHLLFNDPDKKAGLKIPNGADLINSAAKSSQIWRESYLAPVPEKSS